MSWRDQLRPASFRGVPFFVETSETEGGRRLVIHEYPDRDDVFPEDLGKKAADFTVRAYLIGDEFITERDALIKEMNTGGMGTLVLPTQGSKKVVAKDWRLAYDRREGGMEYLELAFIEQGKNRFPAEVVDTGSKVQNAADTAVETLRKVFESVFSVQATQDFVPAAATEQLQNFATTISKAGSIRAKLSSEAALLDEAVNTFSGKISTLMLAPSNLAGSVASLVGQVRTVFGLPVDAYLAYTQLLNFGRGFPSQPIKTLNQQRLSDNQSALVSLVRRATLVEMSRTASELEFDSYDDAVALRDSLAEKIDDELLAVGDTDLDDVYLDLNAVMAAMVTDITTRAANLERIRTVSYQETLPSLVVAYEIYETTDRAEEVVRRNKIEHPGFIPAGKPVQILI